MNELPPHPTVGDLRAYRDRYDKVVIDWLIYMAYHLIDRRYAMGISDEEGRRLYYPFAKKMRSLRVNQRPFEIFDSFAGKLKQGDFLDYRRKDCETLRTVTHRQRTRERRELKRTLSAPACV